MDYKSQLAMLESMTPDQRQLHFQVELLQMEESWLKFMVDSMKEVDQQVEFFTSKAKHHYKNYELYGDDLSLDLAEQYLEAVENTKESRYKLKEVREQRERVQCQRKIVNQLTKKMLNEKPIEKLKS